MPHEKRHYHPKTVPGREGESQKAFQKIFPELATLPSFTANSQLLWLPSSHWFGCTFLCWISALRSLSC